MSASQEDLSSIYAAGHVVLASRAEELPGAVVRSAMQALGADDASLMTPGPDGKLHLRFSSRIPREEWRAIRIPIGGSIAGRVAATRRPEMIQQVLDAQPSSPRRPAVHSSIVYPLVSGERLLGVLNLNRVAPHERFLDHDLGRVAALASSVVLALDNAELVRDLVQARQQSLLTQLAGGLAHEVNTPIQFCGDNLEFLAGAFTSLLTLTQLQAEAIKVARAHVDPELLEAVGSAEQEADLGFLVDSVPKAQQGMREGLARIAELVATVKSLSQQQRRSNGRADVHEALNKALQLSAARRDGVAAVDLDLRSVGTVVGDGSELTQVFLTLLTNALAAIERKRAPGVITIRTEDIGLEVTVSIRDSGAGIPAAIRERIFEPFFTTSEVGGGRGLGLAVARSVIEDRHGGSLAFESTEGEGTVFYVHLPSAAREAPT